MAHTCHAAACSTRCANSMFMCRPHWFSLPKSMRDAVWSGYRKGQELDWLISSAYADAATAAVRFVAEREGVTGEELDRALGVYDWLRPDDEPTPETSE